MKKNIILFFVIIQSINGYCQGRNNIWCFGDSALLDFNSGSPVSGACGIHTRGTACSISDSQGNLLFYSGDPLLSLWSSGYQRTGVVFNKNHDIMENGDSLHGELGYHEQIIIPDPGNQDQYYLFHSQESVTFFTTGFFYSKIDLSYNNGLGKVTSKNNQLLSGDMMDVLAAVKHGNGRDWWVITRKSDAWIFGSNWVGDRDYYEFLVTSTGIQNYGIQSIGTLNQTSGGDLVFNKAGNKMVFINWMGLVELYNFDRCTGIISHPVTIESPGWPYNNWSAAFSESGERLYVTTDWDTAHLNQYDLAAGNIHSSRQTIYTFSDFHGCVGAVKLGPDNLIYWTMCYYNQGISYPYPDTLYNIYNNNLSVVRSPEVLGIQCNFDPFSVSLGTGRTYWGLPNNPDYELGAIGGSICDSLGLANGISNLRGQNFGITLTPNPFTTTLHLIVNTIAGEKSKLSIYNSSGILVYSSEMNCTSEELNLSELPAGVYVLFFESKSGVQAKKIVKLDND